jgi:hypothetical protein
MLSFYTAINQGVVLSPICVPEKVGVNENELIKNDFFIKEEGKGNKAAIQH